MAKRWKKSSGFTFIEIMVAVIIIGVLSILGISTFQTAQKKARDMSRKAGLTAVTKALEQYMTDKGQYPASSNDGKILWCGTLEDPASIPCSWGDPLTDVSTTEEEKTVYMASLPKDMITGQTFFYEGVITDGKVKGYKLYARLENGNDADIPTSGQYETTCKTGDTSNAKYCNYVITSDTVAKPVGCGIDNSACALASDCCTGTCNSYFKSENSQCVEAHFCGTTAPTNYFATRKLDDGQPGCISGTDCCSGTCGTYYTYASGSCVIAAFCGTSVPSGYTERTIGDACSQNTECCGGYCCGGKCQATPCCVEVAYYRDQDNDGYPIQSDSKTSCGAPSGYIAGRADGKWDCCDTDNRVYPGSSTCLSTVTNCGGYDYNCSGSQTTCGTSYYTFSGGITCHNHNCGPELGGPTSATPVGCGVGGNSTGGKKNFGKVYMVDECRKAGKEYACAKCGVGSCYFYSNTGSGTQACQ